MEDLGEGGRRLPDGQEIRWRSAGIRQEGRALPFLIEDLTPRERRVPAADHPNGAAGISRLEISTPDLGKASRDLALLIDAPSKTLKLGACEISPVRQDGERREGPSAIGLSTDAPAGAGDLDPGLSHGVRFAFSSGAGS